ncbi:aquaporin-like protein [Athelia psychrophila]|uniref:Aquaporin-like protein n=1 Tax=Athelia psychrophila TaxID=1759441 RepID=A0A166L672_9AGAM|nr:aquaporin-like protein [Fibularhizoctonia sp. CBS 109695]
MRTFNPLAAKGNRNPEYDTTPRSHFSTFKLDLQAAALEFVGTTFFLLLGLGGIQAVSSESGDGPPASTVEKVLYISTCMGLSLLVSAWLFFRVTGALFNPNISLALLLVGLIRPVRFVLYCIAQMAGAIAAAALVLALTPGRLASNNVLATGVNSAQGVFIEMFITAALVLAVLMLAAERHNSTPFAPIGIGLTLFACHLWAVFYTGACMNTARAFGPAAVTGFPYTHHWVYWVGPFLGSVLGATFYNLLRHYRYWNFAPGEATVDNGNASGAPLAGGNNHAISGTDGYNDRNAAGTSGAGMGDSKLNGRTANDSAV